jgi:hypothetical protein
MKTNQLLLAGALGLGVYLLTSDSTAASPTGQNADTEGGGDTPEIPAGPSRPRKPAPPAAPQTGFPLRRGSRGEAVRKLQTWLGVSADGVFGPATERALRQRAETTSVASQVVLNALLGNSKPTAKPAALTLLAKAVGGAVFTTVGGKTTYRQSPDVAMLKRTLEGRSDTALRMVLGAFKGVYANTIDKGNLAKVLDFWGVNALNRWGLYQLRVRIGKLSV